MVKRTIDHYKSFTLYTTLVGGNRLYLTASVINEQANPISTCAEIYRRIADSLTQTNMQIVQERLFGSIEVQPEVLKAREEVLRERRIAEDLAMTYIEGQPYWGKGFAGVQIRAVQPDDKVWTIYDNQRPCGRGWNWKGATFLMLQNLHGFQPKPGVDNSRQEQAARMFDRAERLLRSQGASYRQVVRTWIYLSQILDWYTEFNQVRNTKYQQFGLLPNPSDEQVAEQIYLPASTGIRGDNPYGAASVMDVLAVVPHSDQAIKVVHTVGVKQRSPFRYRSAFSRAVCLREPDSSHILVSGTASIDEQGKSLFLGDTRAQILKTIEVVEALIAQENASLKDICDATVFLKKPEDISIYREVASECGLDKMPAVCLIADVCREELLFELDAEVVVMDSRQNY
ncbi:MAG: Rid family hydrolase, partial [candidate division KSB1 bacterium]|nr:Rid family hydrolase [candidate division KSB1 bacterium]